MSTGRPPKKKISDQHRFSTWHFQGELHMDPSGITWTKPFPLGSHPWVNLPSHTSRCTDKQRAWLSTVRCNYSHSFSTSLFLLLSTFLGMHFPGDFRMWCLLSSCSPVPLPISDSLTFGFLTRLLHLWFCPSIRADGKSSGKKKSHGICLFRAILFPHLD